MERLIRVAKSFEEADAFDREDMARLSFAERSSVGRDAPPPMQRVRVGRLRDQGREEALYWAGQSVKARVAAALKLHACGGWTFMAKLHDDWTEFLRLLGENRVRFVVVGAHAVAAHGRPRLTGDLDVLVEPTLENGRRMARALTQFGFGGLEPESLTQPDAVVFLGREPFRIDVLTSIDGVTWKSAWEGRLRSELGGVPVAFLGLRQLLRNKRTAGRPKDLADVALLTEKNAPRARAQQNQRPRRKKLRSVR